MTAGSDTGGRTIRSAGRAFTVLRMLADHDQLGIGEIAARLDVSHATAHRLVSTCVQHQLAEQISAHGKYRLRAGVTLWPQEGDTHSEPSP